MLPVCRNATLHTSGAPVFILTIGRYFFFLSRSDAVNARPVFMPSGTFECSKVALGTGRPNQPALKNDIQQPSHFVFMKWKQRRAHDFGHEYFDMATSAAIVYTD